MAGTEEVEVAPSQVGASLGIGALSGLLVAAAALVLGIVPWYELGPALATVLVVLALAYSYLSSLSANALGARGRMAAALALVGFAPVLGHAALRTLQTPLFGQPVRGAAEATSGVLVALLCLSAGGAAAWWWATRRRAPRGRVLHGFAVVAVAACGVLVSCAVWDARRMPSPETYTASLPLVASLPPGEPIAAFSEVRPSARQVNDRGFALGRTCITGKCFVHVRRGDHVRGLGPRLALAVELGLGERVDVAPRRPRRALRGGGREQGAMLLRVLQGPDLVLEHGYGLRAAAPALVDGAVLADDGLVARLLDERAAQTVRLVARGLELEAQVRALLRELELALRRLLPLLVVVVARRPPRGLGLLRGREGKPRRRRVRARVELSLIHI